MNGKMLGFIKNLNLSEIMNTANRTLSVAKKAIPVYKEVRPFFEGKKSIFKKENKEAEIIDERPIKPKEINDSRGTYNDNLTFFQ